VITERFEEGGAPHSRVAIGDQFLDDGSGQPGFCLTGTFFDPEQEINPFGSDCDE
jgi:hypothetical protein